MPKCVLGQSVSGRRAIRGLYALVAAITLGASAVPVCAGLSIAQKEERRHEIDKLEDAWRSAVLASNTKALDALLADDYMAITPSGTIQTKEDTLQGIRSGRFRVASLTISDRRVRFYGETAVVTSLAEIQGSASGDLLTGSYRYTRVYVRNAQGQWKIVSFEASQISESGPHKRNEAH